MKKALLLFGLALCLGACSDQDAGQIEPTKNPQYNAKETTLGGMNLKGKVKQVTTKYYYSNNDLSSTDTQYFNEQGYIVSENHVLNDKDLIGAGGDYTTTFTYNSQNKPTLIEALIGSELVFRHAMVYDASGKKLLTKTSEYADSSTGPGYVTVKEFTYDENNRKTQVIITDSEDNSAITIKYEYTDKGYKEKIYDSTGECIEISFYEYDAFGNMTYRGICEHEDVASETITTSTQWTYNEYRDMITEKNEGYDNYFATFEYTYDKEANWVKKQSHNDGIGTPKVIKREIMYY